MENLRKTATFVLLSARFNNEWHAASSLKPKKLIGLVLVFSTPALF
jgi:hypothetical protein